MYFLWFSAQTEAIVNDHFTNRINDAVTVVFTVVAAAVVVAVATIPSTAVVIVETVVAAAAAPIRHRHRSVDYQIRTQNLCSVACRVRRHATTIHRQTNRKSRRVSFESYRLDKKSLPHRAVMQPHGHAIVECSARCWVRCRNSARKNHGWSRKRRKRRKSKRNWRTNRKRNGKRCKRSDWTCTRIANSNKWK